MNGPGVVVSEAVSKYLESCIQLGELADRSFIEEWSQENGNYQSYCIRCQKKFIGHKRRCICKTCEQK